jgi:mono/diheme cytochrome c family protein
MKNWRLALGLAALPLFSADGPGDPREFFETKIRPLLVRNCHACHTAAKQGGLELTSHAALLKGGNSGPAVVAGDPEHSLLIRAVSYTHEKIRMPPSAKLSAEEIRDLAAWVKLGAVWPGGDPAASTAKEGYRITPAQRAFWSFQPVRKPNPPPVRDKAWSRSPIDRFILSALEAKGLKPGPPAPKRTLIRRAYFDLTGLPPAPEEVDAFAADNSPNAFAKVVDRLLESPHYGERWGRYWLDIARYSDDKLNSTMDEPYPNSFRYRDWVIQAFNDDLPYDEFVKAQIAGDLLETPGRDKAKLAAALGFYALSPEFQDDRVDATTRGFLGLTAACAQCHDHKFDPIPTKDYYGLLGVFTSTKTHEWPLAEASIVERHKARKKAVEAQKEKLKQFLEAQASQLAEILAGRAAEYLSAADKPEAAEGLDGETLARWKKYLAKKDKEHPFLKAWLAGPEAGTAAAATAFQELLLSVAAERKSIEEKNFIRLGGSKARNDLSRADLLSLDRDKYFLWKDFFSPSGILYYNGDAIGRFLSGEWKTHLDRLRADLDAFEKAVPEQYPFLHTITDVEQPKNQRIHIRGSRDNLGDEAPRGFLSILRDGEPQPFRKGSGRLELAEAIADPANPLTPRVMANRIWLNHFGSGIVRTPSNFGQLGERPSHPELLDYLAARFLENKWSIKAMHREIMLSAVYALSSQESPRNAAADPDNRYYWRANVRRHDAEALRDSLLFVSGRLDASIGGPAARLTDSNRRRTVYAFVSRRRPDATLALFDFPNPNNTSEQRDLTSTPLQRLFFLNSGFVMNQAAALACRLESEGPDPARIRKAYRILFGREPSSEEAALGLAFLKQQPDSWTRYAHVLLSANEFLFVN